MEPRKLEVLEQRHVPVIAAGADEDVASHVAKHAGLVVSRHLCERRLSDEVRIIPTGRGTKRGIVIYSFLDLERSHCVASNLAADTRVISVAGRGIHHVGAAEVSVRGLHRLTAEEAGNAADLPLARRAFEESVGDILEERLVVDVVQHQHVRAVQVRGAAPARQIVIVIDRGGKVGCGRVVDIVRPSVGGLEGKPMTKA